MNKIRIAINGFGRIGRITLRHLLNNPNIEVAAINDLTNVATLAHLLKYDSVHGRFPGDVGFDEKHLIAGENAIPVFSEKQPHLLPWRDLAVDLVLECSGKFRTTEAASAHLEAGAKRVLISAPSDDNTPTLVLGVNDHLLNEDWQVLSNASCTTNCLAPMVQVLDDLASVESGYLATIHAYTSDQNLIDAPHKDLRRARSAAVNIIPTTTGATQATELVLPHLKGRLHGISYRVPVPDGSITDFTCMIKKEVSARDINDAFRAAASGRLLNILEFTDAPIVSSDITGNHHSCIFDSQLTVVRGKMVKVVGWYDNETGYSARLADVAERVRQKASAKAQVT
ncbi:MAG: type I glyceraldehyde-3-phosphate dehydrogenase [Bacteroidia bacterium]